jgi:hypothetical protein
VSDRRWGEYGGNLEALVELNDLDVWTELEGCVLLSARPEESKRADVPEDEEV